MNEVKSKKAIKEMMELCKQNKIEELKKISNDNREEPEKIITANLVLQIGTNLRKY